MSQLTELSFQAVEQGGESQQLLVNSLKGKSRAESPVRLGLLEFVGQSAREEELHSELQR